MSKFTRLNHQITAKELRIIDEEGTNLGVMSKEEALKKAEELGLDLIEITPQANPPIAKIIDYGKWQYMEKRKAKAAKAGSKSTETKSLQVKIGTGDHDLELKARRAGTWLTEGHRVKIELFVSGRAKYFDQNFLNDRLERLLRLIPVDYRIAEPAKRGPKGPYLIVERDKSVKSKEGEEIPGKPTSSAPTV
ncbi:MAG: translation initiation factor IF-3 [Candidatus Vogelbacteria bacterium RIFOXYD1_FULL_46_19]|uniref:Translation initiation factor IF-3 n=1 Tax=Candidatus Vogelbacteria bacterium RIFOXYD1_FULL_46_19 TaxID=1802439 RepID=A0A1G2QI66_9BACT|nr:MAG: translation initiation factor IF-3 [Candidatus Vogelbacteria bacterium RIFOXYD1_FULL_46_19]